MASTHHSSVVMLVLLILFAVIHSGGAALRSRAEAVIGARAWRLIFAAASIPSAVVVIGWFLAHRYDGVRLWNLQGVDIRMISDDSLDTGWSVCLSQSNGTVTRPVYCRSARQ